MNDLSINTIQTMSSREIAEIVKSRHDNVKRAIERMIKSNTIRPTPLEEVKNSQGQTVAEYRVGKRDSYVVVAQLSPEFTAALVDRWQELEKQAAIPQTYAEALQLAANQALQIEHQQKQIALQAPKAEFYDQVTGSRDAISMNEAAKVLNMGIGRNKLFKFLRDIKVLQGNNMPYQEYIDRGYFRVIESKFTKPNGDISINFKTVVYQSGLDFMRKRLARAK